MALHLSHLASKVELNTCNGFLCMTLLLWLEVFGSKLPKFFQCPKYCIADDPQMTLKQLEWGIVGFEILSWRLLLPLYVLSHELGYLGLYFLNYPTVMPQIPSSVYKFLLELPLGLNRAWANLIRNLSLRMLIIFFCMSDHDWFGTLGPQLFWTAKDISFSFWIF